MLKRYLALLGGLIVVVLATASALAQDGAPGGFIRSIWDVLQPTVLAIVSVVGPAVGLWIAGQIVRLLNIQSEDKRLAAEAKIRDALHASAMNAVKYAATELGWLPKLGDIIPPEQLLELAAGYVRSKNPDTAEKAKVDDAGLREILLGKVPDLMKMLAEAAPAAPTRKTSPGR